MVVLGVEDVVAVIVLPVDVVFDEDVEPVELDVRGWVDVELDGEYVVVEVDAFGVVVKIALDVDDEKLDVVIGDVLVIKITLVILVGVVAFTVVVDKGLDVLVVKHNVRMILDIVVRGRLVVDGCVVGKMYSGRWPRRKWKPVVSANDKISWCKYW